MLAWELCPLASIGIALSRFGIALSRFGIALSHSFTITVTVIVAENKNRLAMNILSGVMAYLMLQKLRIIMKTLRYFPRFVDCSAPASGFRTNL